MKQAVDVSWKDNFGNPVTDGQEGYTITNGVLDEDHVQRAFLTISADALGV